MSDWYSSKRRRVARLLHRWRTGEVTITRTTRAAPDAATPWIPGTPTLDVYALDARVNGVSTEHVDGTTIVASDLIVIASPKARHTTSDGSPADGAIVDIEPRMSDILHIGGAEKTIKKVQGVPAGGPAAMFHIFVAS